MQYFLQNLMNIIHAIVAVKYYLSLDLGMSRDVKTLESPYSLTFPLGLCKHLCMKKYVRSQFYHVSTSEMRLFCIVI